MRTDLPLHSKNKNRAKHLEEINLARLQMTNLTQAILAQLLQNYSKKELIKIFGLLKTGHDLVFEKRPPKGKQIALFGPEIFLPSELNVLLNIVYPEKKREDIEL